MAVLLAEQSARASFQKDLLFRRWAAVHGGVYVPPTEATPPNPYLSHIPDRDVTTSTGKKLTLVNPAYMTRQVHELGREGHGEHGHITSLNPIRPENAADPWEAGALRTLESGEEEVSALLEIDGAPHLRLMRPLATEVGCLKCHAAQGYKVGDLRGGISVSIPMAPYTAAARHTQATLALIHVVVGLLVLVGLFATARMLRRSDSALRESEEMNRAFFRASPMGIHMYELEANDRLVLKAANPAADRLTGVHNTAHIGETIEEAFPPLERTEIPHRYRKAASCGESWSTEQIDYDHGGISGAFEVSVVARQVLP